MSDDEAKSFGRTVDEVLQEALLVLRQETVSGGPSLLVIAYKGGDDLLVTGWGRAVNGASGKEVCDAVARALAPYAGNRSDAEGRSISQTPRGRA